MHAQHPLIELYVTVGDDQQNTMVEELLETARLDDITQRTLQRVGVTQPVMLTLLLTDDQGIQEMNQQYRDQAKPTDVLSFPLLEQPLVNAPADVLWPIQAETDLSQAFVSPPDAVMNLGDIVMSWPTIVRQATAAGHSPIHELLYLLSHGVLHLVGYDDQTEAGYQTMVHIQQTVLQESGVYS